MEWLKSLVEKAAAQWGVSTQTAWRLFWIPLVATLYVTMLRSVKPLFSFLLVEDGPVEWLTFAFLLGTVVLAVLVGRQRLRSAHYIQGLLFLGFALAMFFAAGEEISWGERILEWETLPETIEEFVEEFNEQDELNVHNLRGALSVTNAAMLLIGAYGTLGVFISEWINPERYWEDANYLFVPPVFLATFFVVIFLFRIVRLFILTRSNFTLNRIAEWAEMLLAAGLLSHLWMVYIYLRQKGRVNLMSAGG